jgi:hypothetical protein
MREMRVADFIQSDLTKFADEIKPELPRVRPEPQVVSEIQSLTGPMRVKYSVRDEQGRIVETDH